MVHTTKHDGVVVERGMRNGAMGAEGVLELQGITEYYYGVLSAEC